MDVYEVFDQAIQIESKMADFYKEASTLCKDKSLSDELINLAQEEIDHMNLLITGKIYVSEAPEGFELNDEAVKLLELAQDSIQTLFTGLHDEKKNLELLINDALQLEKLFVKFHLKSIVNIKIPSLKQLFEALSRSDEMHVNGLSSIIGRLKTKD